MGRAIKKNRKGQYYIFTVIALLIIMMAGIKIFFDQIYALIDPYNNPYNSLVREGNLAIDSILSEGYPTEWDTNNLVRLGILKGDLVDYDKFKIATTLSYPKLKELLGITHDFIIFFEDLDGNVSTIYDICGFGSPEIKFEVINRSIAYYSENPQRSMNIKIINGTFATDFADVPFDSVIDKFKNYSVIFMDQYDFSNSSKNQNISDYINNGGIVFFYGANETNFVYNITFGGVNITHLNLSGSLGDAEFKIFTNDPYINLRINDFFNITGPYTFLVQDKYSINFLPISRFSGGSPKLGNDSIGNSSFARWQIGGGLVYFTAINDSQTTVKLFNNTNLLPINYKDEIAKGISRMAEGKCNMTLPDTNNLVKTIKFIRYSKVSIPVYKKIVMYIWA